MVAVEVLAVKEKPSDQSACNHVGYDGLARVYWWLEFALFQNRLRNARLALIGSLDGKLIDSPRVLVLGDGDGRLLVHLCRAMPSASFISVDQSNEMLRLQQLRIGQRDAGRVRWIQADASEVDESKFPPETYDLLITAFFCDCFSAETLERCLPVWIQSLKSNGLLYWADFVQPESGWRHYRAKFYLGLMQWFFRRTTSYSNAQLVDIPAILVRQSIACIDCKTTDHGLIETRLYQRR